jgi:hypothetical protein
MNGETRRLLFFTTPYRPHRQAEPDGCRMARRGRRSPGGAGLRRALSALWAGGAGLCDGHDLRGRARLPARPAPIGPSVVCSSQRRAASQRLAGG